MIIEDIFDKYENDPPMTFSDIKTKYSERKDLHAMILLDKLFPSKHKIIPANCHDEFYLGVSYNEIKTLSPENIAELIACGVFYNPSYECLYMMT